MASYIDLGDDDEKEQHLIKDIEATVKRLKQSKSSHIKDRWSLLGKSINPGLRPQRSKPLNKPLNDYSSPLRPNHVAHVAPSETVDINPQFIVGLIKPLIMDYVKAWLKDFRSTIMIEIREEIGRHIEIGMAEFDFERQKELKKMQANLVLAD